jgi:hypothetical protein
VPDRCRALTPSGDVWAGERSAGPGTCGGDVPDRGSLTIGLPGPVALLRKRCTGCPTLLRKRSTWSYYPQNSRRSRSGFLGPVSTPATLPLDLLWGRRTASAHNRWGRKRRLFCSCDRNGMNEVTFEECPFCLRARRDLVTYRTPSKAV